MQAKTSMTRELQKRLHEVVTQKVIVREQRTAMCSKIADYVLSNSKVMEQRNFRALAQSDLARMLDAYDEIFFDRSCLELARLFGMTCRLSSRMTRAGGKTIRTSYPAQLGRPASTQYEIALSSSLLFQTFRDDQQAVRVCGLLCEDRLAAMQRIVEHELIHLSEMLVWIDSDCAKSRFQNITNRMFGHTEHRHELMTQHERARQEFNIRLGDRVIFRFDNRQRVGRVNRITRRVTVLVESEKGELFTDGKRYERFYVPLNKLRKVD